MSEGAVRETAMGEHPAFVAAAEPDRIAVVMAGSGETRTYRELDEASRRLALALHDRGLRRGDHLAVLLDNRPAFFEAVWAGLRSGLYVTPINWHLTAAEAAFIASDCGASALVAGAALAPVVSAQGSELDDIAVRLAVGGSLPGFEAYQEVVDGRALDDDPDPCEGQWMFYSSGTTGRPKGIVPGPVGQPLGNPSAFTQMLTGLWGFTGDTVYLSPAPLYHAAPAGWSTTAQRIGGTVVVLEQFDPVEFLAAIERFRVSHVQVVPTHLVRLLKLPAEVRERYDLSSLRMVVHAAAPCPIEVKRAAIEWLGPIVNEYYAGSEGNGFCAIGSEEWLARPGSVGRSLLGAIHIVGAGDEEVPTGDEGQVWFETARRFEYHGDPVKTASAWNDKGWSTIGDIGKLDEDGYLYLTDRASNMIISGGVNIYPQEVEDLLLGHPAVLDAAVIGTPHPDLGEQVTAFVQPDRAVSEPGAADVDLPDALIAYCREHLAHFKCPRTVNLVDELPRLPTGKLLKRLLR
ncbi:MAG: AMP-dependent synthetase and ligase [Acidimicrobiales bacterium]|nr:AMP-dependent synthetase and ligase [Acidimicrobiales bacterium]